MQKQVPSVADPNLKIMYPKSSNDRKFLLKYINSNEKHGEKADPNNLNGILKSNRMSVNGKG